MRDILIIACQFQRETRSMRCKVIWITFARKYKINVASFRTLFKDKHRTKKTKNAHSALGEWNILIAQLTIE